MKLKLAVKITLISCGVLSALLIFTGFVFGKSTINTLNSSKTVAGGDGSITSDAQGGGEQNSDEESTTDASSSGSGSSSGSESKQDPSSPGGGGGGTTTPTNPGGGGGGGTPAASISSFTASPSSINYNSASTLSWASANAASCSISTLGAVATSGTKSTGNLTSTKTYTLTCGTASKNVTVTVGSAPIACGQSGGTCTAAQVAAHATQGDCWMIYNGYYYIVTSYLNNHPGGRSVFNTSSCGRDITAYMNGSASTGGQQHRHSGGAYNVLNSYRIGQVQG